MIKNIKQLASAIANAEGKKVPVSIGNAREVIGIISDLSVTNPETTAFLIQNGLKRAKRKK